MRHRITLSVCLAMIALVALTVTVRSQTYYIQGLHRQGNAEDARSYLGVFVSSNWFTTSTNGATVPLSLLTNISFVQMDSNTWFLATNWIQYTNNLDLPGVIVGAGIGTNMLPYVRTNDLRVLNLTNALNSYSPKVLTNNRVISTTFSNDVYVCSSSSYQMSFINNTIGIDGGSTRILLVGGPGIQIRDDASPLTDKGGNLGDATHFWRHLRLYQIAFTGGVIVSSNSWTNMTAMAALVPGDVYSCSSNGVPTFVSRYHDGTYKTNQFTP